MRYTVVAETDIGIRKNINQDSVLVKHAETELGEILLAVVCDGMGGMDKGELASATVIRSFATWFEQELPKELVHLDFTVIAQKWELMIREFKYKNGYLRAAAACTTWNHGHCYFVCGRQVSDFTCRRYQIVFSG